MNAWKLSALVIATGCALEADDLAQVEQADFNYNCDSRPDQYKCGCTGCGGNGLAEGPYNSMFAEFNRNALDDHGAWNWGSDEPIVFCAPGTATASTCDLAPQYSAWVRGG